MSSRKVSNLTKKKVAASQEWKCKSCSNILNECFEIDHIVCLKDQGSNEESNLQALCPNCHRIKTNNDISKTKEPKKPKEKIILPTWWNEYLNHPERQGQFVCGMIKSSYPNLFWHKDITNLNKYNINELKIMLASINGNVKNGSKQEIISFIRDESNKKTEPKQEITSVHRALGFTNLLEHQYNDILCKKLQPQNQPDYGIHRTLRPGPFYRDKHGRF